MCGPQNDLREEVVEKVKWQVNRDSAEDKLRDFLEWMYALKKDTLHHVSVIVVSLVTILMPCLFSVEKAAPALAYKTAGHVSVCS